MSESAAEIAMEWLTKSQQPDELGWTLLDEAPYEDPELAWQGVLSLLQRDLTPEQLALLAAGPLETLLSLHGSNYIERVESEATQNPRFNYLLGEVWRCNASQDVWDRVQKARKETW